MNVIYRVAARLEEVKAFRELWPVVILTVLWAAYFWRVLTSNQADQVSLPQGDFSGQFLAFGAYQAQRMLAGEIPLWNPYNNAGHPFLADTQSAVFYPIRLLTIFVSQLAGGWSYQALQIEVMAHYWLMSVLMYAFLRNTTGRRLAGMVSALTITYGGYLTGYPPLQVAVLEAGIWLPLILLGIFRASESAAPGSKWWDLKWLAVSSLALGISLLAGHPQTTLFMVYVLVAFAIYRAIVRSTPVANLLIMSAAVIFLGFGLAAVQIVPSLEYTALTTRSAIEFDARSNGFPFSDIITFFVPNVFTVWSPLYSGVVALSLGAVALHGRVESARFWGLTAAIALVVAFGGATIVYQLAYLGLPGLALFRGQERAAYIVAFAVATMAGLGAKALQNGWLNPARTSRVWIIISIVCWALAVETLVARVALPSAGLDLLTQWLFFLAILATLNWLVFEAAARGWRAWPVALVGLVVFDLFSVTMRSNWESTPISQRQLLSDLVPVAQSDEGLFRVDGRVGLGENYGTMVGLQDIRGTSPLRLASLENYIALPQYRMHQLLAVKYVFTDWTQLEVPSTVRSETMIGSTRAFLHELESPTPRAWMVFTAIVAQTDKETLALIADPAFDPLHEVVLSAKPKIALSNERPTQDVQIVQYLPELISIDAQTSDAGILVISELDYPGWVATVDGNEASIIRANAGLRAIVLDAGSHRVEFAFRPNSVLVGGFVTFASALALLCLAILGKRITVNIALKAQK